MSMNALEANSFLQYLLFVAFWRRGGHEIIKFIARDEAHLTGTQHILNIMPCRSRRSEMAEIAGRMLCKPKPMIYS